MARRPAKTFAAEWKLALATELNNNFLMDSPKGKTAFASGGAYVLVRLAKDSSPSAVDRLWSEIEAFCDAYMAGSAQE
jgi:hypothetical protein